MKRSLLILAILVVFMAPVVAQTVRVGSFENSPKIYTEDGEVKGFWADIVNYLAEQNGWDVVWVHGTWEEQTNNLDSGAIDLMPDVAYSGEREEQWDFTKETVLTSWSSVYVTPEERGLHTALDSGGKHIHSILDLEGMRIGVIAGSINYVGPQGIKTILTSFDIEAEYVEYDTYEDVFAAVQAGDVDAGVTNKIFGGMHAAEYGLEDTSILISPINMMFAMPKGAALNAQLTASIDPLVIQMKDNPNSIYYHALETNLGDVEVIEVIPEWAIGLIAVLAVLLAIGGWALLISRESQQMYKALIDRSPIPSALLDKEGKFISVNRAFIQSTGFLPADVIGKHFVEITAKEYRNNVESAFSRIVGGGASATVESGLVTKAGLQKTYEVRSELIRRGGKSVVVTVLVDTTEKKRMWTRLNELQKKGGKKK